MPKVPIDYSKTIIYKLVHKDDLDDVNIYIGHTTNFTERKRTHKKSCCNPKSEAYNYKLYKYIRQKGGWDEWTMIKIEDYNCKDIHEARVRERYWMKELKSILNKQEPCRTDKEYYEANKNKLEEKIQCDKCGCVFRKDGLTRHKKTQKCINYKSCNIIENGIINKSSNKGDS